MGDMLGQWLQHYGYWAVLLGCLLEGETIVILAGIAVHKAIFSLPWLLLIVWVGGASGDVLLYFLGRRYGERLLHKLPGDKARLQKAQRLVRRHQYWTIIGVRFLYGLRLIGPAVIGASHVPIRRFLVLNLLGAALWAVLFTLLGYCIGPSMLRVYAQIERYQVWVLSGIGLLIVAFWSYHGWRMWCRRGSGK